MENTTKRFKATQNDDFLNTDDYIDSSQISNLKKRLTSYQNQIEFLFQERLKLFCEDNTIGEKYQVILDNVKEKDLEIIELKQRLLGIEGESSLTQTDKTNIPNTQLDIHSLINLEMKRLRDSLDSKDKNMAHLIRDYELLKSELERERKLKSDTKLEKQLRLAHDNLKLCEEAKDKLKKECDLILEAKNLEINHIVKNITDITEKFENHIGILEKDIKRLRKERDTSRELYEQLNSQFSSQNKLMEDVNSTLSILMLENSQLRNQNKSKDSSEDLNSLYEAFETFEKKYDEIVKKVNEKDEMVNNLKNEKLKMEFDNSQVNRQLDLQISKYKTSNAALNISLSESIERENRLRQKIIQMEEKVTSFDLYEKTKYVESHEPENATISRLPMEDLSKIKSFSHEIEYLKSELDSSRNQLNEFYLNGGVNIKELKEQVDLYKRLLKCNSCKTRDKNAVIVKCMHVFCRTCLDMRIETRQRKCPNCGEPFGQGDIRNIFL